MFSRYQHHSLPFYEFIALMALMMSLVALSIDAMLPALSIIGDALNVSDPNDNQLIIGMLFLGLGFGQLLFGPLSDSIGRRKPMVIGYALFIVASLWSVVAEDFNSMLASRFLQGFGVAAPRVLTTAIVRDLYKGRAMARVMSFVSVIFILVPMIAPMLGQTILLLSNWQMIFIAILLMGLLTLVWYLIRQGETLPAENRTPFTPSNLFNALKYIVTHRIALGYTVLGGIIFGPFMFYLSSAQQLFQETYGLATWFPVHFAGLAFAIGIASFFNGKWVMAVGMKPLTKRALLGLSLLSIIFFMGSLWFDGLPPLWAITVYLVGAFFCMGLLFGNLNALAMEPLGEFAGMGAAVVGSLSIFISVPISSLIGQLYNDTAIPLVSGFAIAAVSCLLLMKWIETGREASTT